MPQHGHGQRGRRPSSQRVRSDGCRKMRAPGLISSYHYVKLVFDMHWGHSVSVSQLWGNIVCRVGNETHLVSLLQVGKEFGRFLHTVGVLVGVVYKLSALI